VSVTGAAGFAELAGFEWLGAALASAGARIETVRKTTASRDLRMGRIRNSGFRDSTDDVDRLEPERIVLNAC
jgi:hypothetical protein